MKYYLDTNAIYNLKKLPPQAVGDSFYSVFGLIEIIAGVSEEEFQRRKAVLVNLVQSSASCDYSFPEKILLEAFDYFDQYDFIEKRADDLFGIMDDLAESDSFADFQLKSALAKRSFTLEQVIRTDQFYTSNFLTASAKGHQVISATLAERGDKSISLDGKKFDMVSRKDLGQFLSDKMINESFTIFSLTQTAMHIAKLKGKKIEKEIFESYNGKLGICIKAFSEYSRNQFAEKRTPSRNDFQDLLHLYYLRNSDVLKIVTDDKIFRQYIPENCIKPDMILE